MSTRWLIRVVDRYRQLDRNVKSKGRRQVHHQDFAIAVSGNCRRGILSAHFSLSRHLLPTEVHLQMQIQSLQNIIVGIDQDILQPKKGQPEVILNESSSYAMAYA